MIFGLETKVLNVRGENLLPKAPRPRGKPTEVSCKSFERFTGFVSI